MDIVLVHRAWCGGWVWRDLAELLHARGHHVRVVEQLPGSADGSAVSADLAADAAHVRAEFDRCTGEVVLVRHSYGGASVSVPTSLPRNDCFPVAVRTIE